MRNLLPFSGRDLHRFGLGGAWLFIIGSGVALLWLIVEGGGWQTGGHVFGANVNNIHHTAIGLTYHGFFGAVFLWMQFIALAAASALSFSNRARLRRIALAYLIAWAAVWTFGAAQLAVVDPGFWTLQIGFMAALLGCTTYRACRNWSHGTPTSPTHPLPPAGIHTNYEMRFEPFTADENQPLTAEDVPPSGTLQQVHAPSPLHRLRETVNAQARRWQPVVQQQASKLGGLARTHGAAAIAATRRFAHQQFSKAAAALKPKTQPAQHNPSTRA